MKQSLHLNLGQHLTMTPQLQQAIRLLQLSSLELQAEVQQALESNPLLEMADDEPNPDAGETAEADRAAAENEVNEADAVTFNAETSAEINLDSGGAENSEVDLETELSMAGIPDELPVDSEWEEIYEPSLTSSSNAPADDDRPYEAQDQSTDGLREYLSWQMGLTPFSETDRLIAATIIDAVSDDGYLPMSLEDIQQAVSTVERPIEIDEVQAVLHRIQNFDPPGVAARNLRECLLIQLRQLPPTTPRLEQAKQLVSEYLDVLGAREYVLLMRKMKIAEEDLKALIALIQTLSPRPGSRVNQTKTEYIVPDVVVVKKRGVWRVDLNPDAMPKLRVNAHYAGMIRRADNSADNTYLRNHLQEARWLIKSLQSRNETLLRVAKCIVERQRGFFEQGEEAMRPLVLHDVAQEVGMHESTISRVTTQKYMHTPRGIYELKFFFSSHVTTADGDACSATAIRALIKKMVSQEDARHPLSDSKLAEFLTKQGINVARRTVTKYREAMSIPPSNERRRFG